MKKLIPVVLVLMFPFTQIVHAKCTKEVTKGMVVKNEVISAGETQIVCNGGKTENVTVEKGGRQLVYLDGKTTGTTVNPFGFQYVGKGGGSEGTTIKEKGLQLVRGVGFNTTISGGVQIVTGGVVGTKIEKGGIQLIDWTAKSYAPTIVNGGIQHVDIEAYGSNEKVKLNKNSIRNVYSSSPSIGAFKDIKVGDEIKIGE